MNFWGACLELFGWKVEFTAPKRDKCVICVAPHTSNYDFILGLFAYYSVGRKANFLMKDFWFFFPMGYLMRSLGGIPVPRRKKGVSLTKSVAELFRTHDYVNLAVTPEGTRSATDTWHTGFLYIAHDAGVPIQLGVIDYKNKTIVIADEYVTTGDVEADMKNIRQYYSRFKEAARYPEKFIP